MTKPMVLMIVVFICLTLISCSSLEASPTATIRWTEVHQVIDGFGGSCADFTEPLPSKMADFFFTASGIGLSLLRIQVIPGMAECESFGGAANA